ncbi:hypothetical protein SAMN06297422_13114 [Lachnospiraceae bacterium]|nr:hypothetical protein SAMN06297422_13114 [Lachnospiraceae bacterium]
MKNNKKTEKYTIVVAILFLLIMIFTAIKAFSIDNLDYEFSKNEIEYDDVNNIYSVRCDNVCEGIYDVTIHSAAESDYRVEVVSEKKYHNSLVSDNPGFLNKYTQNSFNVWVNDKTDSIQINIFPNNDCKIESVSFNTSWNSVLYIWTKALLLALLVVIGGVVYNQRTFIKKYFFEIAGICVISGIASLGVMVRYILPGDDLNFHLMRIEGLKEAFILGDIPCRIQTNWLDGWGSAVSIMYGDLSIVLPALMRFAGFTLNTSYSTFVVFINVLTSISAYCAFNKISKNKYLSIFVCGLYVLSPYRLCDIYIRGAFGEYVSMIFLPLVVLCIYYIFADDTGSEDYGKKVILPVVGLSGIIQTHVLTIVMIIIFGTVFLVFEYKKLFDIKRIRYGLKICAITILLNMWFIVPFIKFLAEDLNVNKKAYHPDDYQWYGLSLVEMIAQKASPSISFNWADNTSLSNRMGLAIGNGFLIFLGIFIYLLVFKKIKNNKKASYITALLGVLALFLTSIYFPYSKIKQTIPFLFSVLAKVNIPFRYMSIAIIMFSFLIVFLYSNIQDCFSKSIRICIFVMAGLISFSQSCDYLYTYLYSGVYENYYDGSIVNVDKSNLGEYIYQGINVYENENKDIITSGCSIVENKSNHNRFNTKIKVDNTDAFLEFPIYYYPGYSAGDINGNALVTEKGTNGRLRVYVSQLGDNSITVRFRGLISWKFADIISLITLIILLFIYVDKFRNIKRYISDFYIKKTEKIIQRKALFFLFVICILSVVFIGILFLNLHTGLVSDDVMYLYNFRTGWPETDTHRFRITDLIQSMNYHRKIWNGRVVAHGLLQILLMLPNVSFRVVNSLLFILLGLLIYFHSSYGQKKSKSLIVLIYVMLWFFIPNFGQTILWASGAASYLWCTCIILGMLIPYRIYIENGKKRGAFFPFIILVCGIIAGCTNENTGGALVLLCLSYCLIFYIQNKHIPLWAVTGIIGEIIGVLFLVSAQGNQRIDSTTDFSGYINRLKDILQMFRERFILLLIFIFLGLILNYIVRVKNNKTIKNKYVIYSLLVAAFFLSGFSSVVVLMFSAIYPPRAMFIACIFMIISFGLMYNSIVFELGKYFVYSICALAVLLCIESYKEQSSNILKTWKQVQYGIDLIEEARESGKTSVEVPILVLNGSEYDAFSETQYFEEDSGTWFNTWMKYLYGVEIKGYSTEAN